jgi:hypothetical protein
MTANRPIPSASAMPATSVAAEARSRPGRGVDPPYPGRSYDTQRMPSRSAAGKQRLGRRAEVRRPVVPEHGPAVLAAVPGGVVHVQGAPAGQLQTGLGHHRPSLMSRHARCHSRVWNGLAASTREVT